MFNCIQLYLIFLIAASHPRRLVIMGEANLHPNPQKAEPLCLTAAVYRVHASATILAPYRLPATLGNSESKRLYLCQAKAHDYVCGL